MANNKEKKDNKEVPEISEAIPEISKDMKEKLEKLKAKLDSFKNKVAKDSEKNVIGIALLPPEEKNKQDINVLVLLNSDTVKEPVEFMLKTTKAIEKIAEDVDKNIKPRIMSLYDLRESCYDGKWEVLKMIAMAAIIHDPTDVLAALKIAEIHKTMSIKKFEKYIVSYVAAGSLFRGEKSNDIDVYIIVDDTDVKRMPRIELKDKLRAIILQMGDEAAAMTGIKKQFHVQTYILTDFWDSIKDAHPVIFTLLRDGIPLYDRGVFMPWKLLLKMGRVKPSQEAIEMQMEVSEKLLERTRYKLLSIVGEDLFYAILNPAQALLMLYGLTPPTPKETIELLDKIFVKEEKLLDRKYVDILEKVRKYFKDIEHGKIKSISGKEIDELLNDAEDYLKKVKSVFEQIQKKRDLQNIRETYDSCNTVTKEILELNNMKFTESNVQSLFKQVADKEKLPGRLLEILKNVNKMEKDFKENKLTSQEIERLRRDARIYLKTCVEYIQRKNLMELNKTNKK